MKFRYVWLAPDGTIVGSNDEALARKCIDQDEADVVDCETGKMLGSKAEYDEEPRNAEEHYA